MTETAPPTPPIMCPEWCIVPTAEHAAELPDLGGYVVHRGDIRNRSDVAATVHLSSSTRPDGTANPSDEAPLLWIDDIPDALTHDEALTFARWLSELLEEARA